MSDTDESTELTRYRRGERPEYLHDWGEGIDLYEQVAKTRDLARMADHDGPVVLNGELVELERDDDGVITAYHPLMGRRGFYTDEDREFGILLNRVSPE